MDKKILKYDNKNNVKIGENVIAAGEINGFGNIVEIGNAKQQSNIHLHINGNHNQIVIDSIICIRSLKIFCGNHVSANNINLKIGTNISMENGIKMLLYNSGNICQVGKNNMFSDNITFRCGESPHLIFDKNTFEYIDYTKGIFIGNNVWIGENSYITKKVTIPDECIIGANSVVTKRFQERNCVIAGNPGRIVKRNVQWFKNSSFLENGSPYKESYELSKKLLS